jgi:hypothetical protein
MGVQPDASTIILRALRGRGTLRVPAIGREASRPYNCISSYLMVSQKIVIPARAGIQNLPSF